MKKQLLSLAVLCAVAFTVNAQTEKGKNLIGGSIGYSKSESKPTITYPNNYAYGDGESTSFNVNPKFGHFFSKNLAIGLGIGYYETKNISDLNFLDGNSLITSTSIQRNKSFNVGPFVRYYVDIVEKFKFFGQGSFDIAFGKSSQSQSGSGSYNYQRSNYKTGAYSASINPGFAFFPAKKWAIEFSFPLLSYNNTSIKDDGGINSSNSQASENNSFRFGLDTFVPSLGFNFHF
ncbi:MULTISPECIES: outer membrane beta-barrel protein [Pedobacter]|uniref:outer membrane beta-barrel protein n=1 Tax=Pedobacter TaxID=84567 RepID=UPI001E5EBB36|nr:MULTISPECIES: outer membrane beta-barrel protein [Pedobacter]